MNLLSLPEKRKIESIERKNLPLGQSLLAMGFKPVTIDQLRERFGYEAIETAENHELKKKELDAFFVRNNISDEGREKYYLKISLQNSDRWYVKRKNYFGDETEYTFYTFRYRLESKSLEDYMDDVIPEQVLKNIEVAKKFGVVSFYIAYFVYRNKIRTNKVALGVVGENHVELGEWG